MRAPAGLTQAVHVVPHRTVGGIALPGTGHRHAGGGVGALVLGFGELPAEPAGHVDDEVLLGPEVLILWSKGHRTHPRQRSGSSLACQGKHTSHTAQV